MFGGEMIWLGVFVWDVCWGGNGFGDCEVGKDFVCIWLFVEVGIILDCDCWGKGEVVFEGYCEGWEVFDILKM